MIVKLPAKPLTAVLALLLAPALLAQHVTKDIVYTSNPSPTRGDLYQPSGAGPFPAIVYIHGGSWRSGNKSGFKQLASDLAVQGYVGFSIDYDLHPHSYPTSYEQSLDAVRFLRSHATEYNIDPQRIMVAGTSAGGQLAALVALAPQGPAGAAHSNVSASVSAAIILNGVFRLGGAHVITRYLGTECPGPAVCTEASPFNRVHANAPPFFVGHGTGDKTVPYAEAEGFAAALRSSGDAVTLYTADGGPHMYWTKKDYYAANLAAVEKFLKF
jgi:acetyl esterase/lipase